jgi:hypothetical protein
MVGCVWAVALGVAGCWSFYWTPVIRYNMAQQRREDQARADEEARKIREREQFRKYSLDMQAAVKHGKPDLDYQLEPGALTPWIDMQRLEEQKKSITFDFGGLHYREYVDWGDRKETLDCTHDCVIGGGAKRVRFENTDTKPGELRIWYF